MVYGVIAHVVIGRQRMAEHVLTRLRYRRRGFDVQVPSTIIITYHCVIDTGVGSEQLTLFDTANQSVPCSVGRIDDSSSYASTLHWISVCSPRLETSISGESVWQTLCTRNLVIESVNGSGQDSRGGSGGNNSPKSEVDWVSGQLRICLPI
ncbi:unnamed protein product [Sphagnum balticum]